VSPLTVYLLQRQSTTHTEYLCTCTQQGLAFSHKETLLSVTRNTCTHIHRHTDMETMLCLRSHEFAHIHVHPHQLHTHMRTHAHAHAHTHTHTCALMPTPTHTHTHTHSHTHSHTHAHAHTHGRVPCFAGSTGAPRVLGRHKAIGQALIEGRPA